jgi:uncharacterized protein with HEPN domain
MRSQRERLLDIVEAINRIERYAIKGREVFEKDELVQNWYIRHLQIIGEAVRLLPSEFIERSANVPWSKIIGMRHILVHDYFEIDFNIVWNVIERDLPELKEEIIRFLNEL